MATQLSVTENWQLLQHEQAYIKNHLHTKLRPF